MLPLFKCPLKTYFLRKLLFFSLFILSSSLLIKRTLGIETTGPMKFWLPPAKAKPMEGNHGQCLYKQVYLPNQEKY